MFVFGCLRKRIRIRARACAVLRISLCKTKYFGYCSRVYFGLLRVYAKLVDAFICHSSRFAFICLICGIFQAQAQRAFMDGSAVRACRNDTLRHMHLRIS